MEDKKLQINKQKLTPEQRDKLESYQHAQDQIKLLEDIALMSQELIDVVDEGKKDDSETAKQIGALLMDMRDSLTALKDKDTPETPDFTKPVVEAVKGLEKALSASIKSIDTKPVVVPAPNVSVEPTKVDLSGVEKALGKLPKAFEEAISKIPETVIPEYPDRWDEVLRWLEDIDTGTRMKPLPGSMVISNLDELSTRASSSVVFSIGDSTTSGILIDPNPSRREVEFYNGSSAILYLLKGAGVASSSNYTVQMNQGDYYSTDSTVAFAGVWASDASGNVLITESS